MLRIWGRNTSINVQKVLWAIGELGIAHERIDVGGSFGKTDTAEYRGMNPTGLVPTLQEDDFTLWESNAICRYLCHAHAPHSKLWPQEPHARANVDRWMDAQQTLLNRPIGVVFWGLVRTPPEKRDQTAIDNGKVKTTDAVKIMDAQLGKTAFMAGDAFSYGDIPVGVMTRRYMELVPERPKMANLERWFGEISARDAFKEHCGGIPLT